MAVFSKKSITFGSGDRIVIPNTFFQFERTDEFTLTLWIKRSSTSASEILLSSLNTTSNFRGIELRIISGTSNLDFTMISDNGSGNRLTVSAPNAVLDDGQWYAVAVVYDGSSSASGVAIYVDGYQMDMSEDVDALTGTIVSGASFAIGARNNGTAEYSGSIDDVGIYDRVLTAQEIFGMHRRGPKDLRELDTADALIGYYLMGDGVTGNSFPVIPDESGEGADGTFTGTGTEITTDVPRLDDPPTPTHIIDADTLILVPFSEVHGRFTPTQHTALPEAWRRYTMSSSNTETAPWPAGGPRQAQSLGLDFSIWFDRHEGTHKFYTASGDSRAHTALIGPAWTVELWVYLSRELGRMTFIQYSAGPTDASGATNYLLLFGVETGRQIFMFWEHGTGVDEEVVSALTIPIDEWAHVAAVCVESGPNRSVTFYVNGVADGPYSMQKATGGSSASWRLGSDATDTNPFYGALSYIRVSSVARSQASIQAEVASPGSYINDDDTLAYWDCQRAAEHLDLSPRGQHAIHYGSAFTSGFTGDQQFGVGSELFPINGRPVRRLISSGFSGALSPRRQDLADALSGDNEYTIEGWINIRGNTSDNHRLFRGGGNSSSSGLNGNFLILFDIRSDGLMRARWEHGSGVDVTLDSSLSWQTAVGVGWEHRWVHAAMRKRFVSVGQCEVDFFINGQLLETVGPATPAEIGNIYAEDIYYVFYLHDQMSHDRGELRVSSVARTDGEILESYERGIGEAGGGVVGPPVKHAMRARNSGDSDYVAWISDGADFNGAQSPVAILPGSAVVEAIWDRADELYEKVSGVPSIQSVSAPATANDPGVGETLVLVDTAAGSWSDADEITLPAAPQTGARVAVKDSTGSATTKTIVVDGNGNTIDGAATDIIGVNYAARSYLYNGTMWSIT